MKCTIFALAMLTIAGVILLFAQTTPVTLQGGESVTVSCTASSPTTCPPVPPDPSGHADHYARHRDQAHIHGTAYCTTCHSANATHPAVAHGPRVFLSPSTFSGPHACYTAPWQSPNFPATDPFGTEVFPAQVCAPDTTQPHLAIFASGTLITCSFCHGGGGD